MLRWSVQIADRGSSGDGGGGSCPGMFIPGKGYIVTCMISPEQRQRKRENAEGKIEIVITVCLREMQAVQGRKKKKKDHYAQSLFFVKNWKETSIAL